MAPSTVTDEIIASIEGGLSTAGRWPGEPGQDTGETSVPTSTAVATVNFHVCRKIENYELENK